MKLTLHWSICLQNHWISLLSWQIFFYGNGFFLRFSHCCLISISHNFSSLACQSLTLSTASFTSFSGSLHWCFITDVRFSEFCFSFLLLQFTHGAENPYIIMEFLSIFWNISCEMTIRKWPNFLTNWSTLETAHMKYLRNHSKIHKLQHLPESLNMPWTIITMKTLKIWTNLNWFSCCHILSISFHCLLSFLPASL